MPPQIDYNVVMLDQLVRTLLSTALQASVMGAIFAGYAVLVVRWSRR